MSEPTPPLDLFEGEQVDVEQLLTNLKTAAQILNEKPPGILNPDDLLIATAIIRMTTFTCVGCGKVFSKEHGEQENMGPGGWHCFTTECEEANS